MRDKKYCPNPHRKHLDYINFDNNHCNNEFLIECNDISEKSQSKGNPSPNASAFQHTSVLRTIRNVLASNFFESLIKNVSINILDIFFEYENPNFDSLYLKKLYSEEVEYLFKLMKLKKEFIKYFNDLLAVVKNIIKYTHVALIIGDRFSIKKFSSILYRRNINLFKSADIFYISVLEIYDFLKKNFPYDLPERFKSNSGFENRSAYRSLVGNNIKLYIIENIYFGRYVRNGKIMCPECLKERFKINTDKIRINSLEFHHESEKVSSYAARNLFNLYKKNQYDPRVLEKIIKQMESENVVLICSAHHCILHANYYDDFKQLINWENVPDNFPQDIFLIPPEIIHFIVWVAVVNYFNPKGEPKPKMITHSARNSIIMYLKKRFILESLGKTCICGEFNTKDHLPVFAFHHLEDHRFDRNPYIKAEHSGSIYTPNQLYQKGYSCSDIIKILSFENGGYLCSNCHSVIEYSLPERSPLKEILKERNYIDAIIKDYQFVIDNFKKINTINVIENPLSTDLRISNDILQYLDAFYEISSQGNEITLTSVMNHLNLSIGGVSAFFKRHAEFINLFISVTYKNPKHDTSNKNIYELTDLGKLYIEIIQYFRNYYRNK